MGNISIKDNGLVALLPKHLRESNELKGAEKLILGGLMLLNNRDFAKENGFIFRTNQDLMKDTGIKSEGTLIKALAKLEINGFINRTSGKRNKASEYRLNMDKIKDKHTVNEIHSNNENSNHSVSDSNLSKTETDVMNSRLERIENLLSTKLDTMIEILQKIHYDNNEVITMINGLNRNSNHSVSVSNHSTDKETESHKESCNNILQIDLSSITSEEIDHLDNFLKKKIIKEKAKYMKDNKISRPDVNVVANSENNGMNITTNNNSTPDHQHTDTTVSPTPESHSHNECTVPSVDGKNNISGPSGPNGPLSGKNNNIQPVQVPASDTSDTSTVLLSGDDGIGCDGGIGKVVNVKSNNVANGMNGVDTTHTTSEDNTNSTEANTGRLAHGNDTPQHQHKSSAKPSKKMPKDAAATVGGGSKKGGAGRNISTSAEQSPTTDEKVDNIAPLDMISAFDDSIERKLWGMLRKRKDVLIFRDFSDINGTQRIGVSDKAKRIINLTDATLDYDFDGNDTFGMLYNNGNGKFRFFATDCNMTITTWDEGKKTDDNPVPNGVF